MKPRSWFAFGCYPSLELPCQHRRWKVSVHSLCEKFLNKDWTETRERNEIQSDRVSVFSLCKTDNRSVCEEKNVCTKDSEERVR